MGKLVNLFSFCYKVTKIHSTSNATNPCLRQTFCFDKEQYLAQKGFVDTSKNLHVGHYCAN